MKAVFMGMKTDMKMWFSEQQFGRPYVVNLKEKILHGPGYEPESPALRALTN